MYRAALLSLLAAALLTGCGGEAIPDVDPSSTGPTLSPAPGATPPSAPSATPSDAVPPLHPSVDGYGEAVIDVGGRRLAVLVADTPDERRHGLMEVTDLPDDVGMLFVYTEDRRGGFWMKDTLIPLSIAFIAADGTIVDILDMEPCASGESCPSYRPDVDYRHALEVEQGWFEGNGVAVGAEVAVPPVHGASSS